MSSSYEIRAAILKAADHIARNPHEFNWVSVGVPKSPGCGTPGCALGWIGAMGGVKARRDCRDISLVAGGSSFWNGPEKSFLGIRQEDFYSRMNELCEGHEWKHSALRCAKVLRLYADKYHPAEKVERNFARELMASLPAEPIAEDAV